MKRSKAIFCKSFHKDLHMLPRLLESCERFAPNLPIVFSVPQKDLSLFKQTTKSFSNAKLIADEEFTPQECHSLPGWFQQQVCKLHVHKLGIADSYLMMDSDAYFISIVGEDVLFDSAARLKVLFSELDSKYDDQNTRLIRFLLDEKVNPDQFLSQRLGSKDVIGRVNETIALAAANPSMNSNQRYAWVNQIFQIENEIKFQPSQFFHNEILTEMQNFFDNIGVTLTSLIKLSPWEYSWYSCFAFSLFTGDIRPENPPAIHFPTQNDYKMANDRGIDMSVISKRFSIVQMNGREHDKVV